MDCFTAFAMTKGGGGAWDIEGGGRRPLCGTAVPANNPRNTTARAHSPQPRHTVAPDLIRGDAFLPAPRWRKLDPGSAAGVTEWSGDGMVGGATQRLPRRPLPSSL
ncbi:hypothetical protein D6858_14290 [Tsuneonella suprasediminis]|uniref:Uncharacterized protein n=1 Tax=Tsuneonella suprasediminis TaxID=2306996 RepID=A0A419QXT0_9SPHN|nr:hypothetical protein D6858_14290 [Tsuneonella suprasediminis]